MQYKSDFDEVVHLIRQAKTRASQSVNRELVDLYWQLGEYISHRVTAQQWGKAVVAQLATFLSTHLPNAGGLSDKNLWRMKQFYETYRGETQLLALLRQISWSNHLIILSGTQSMTEKEFYLKLCIQERYSKRDLKRQLDSGYFERVMLANEKLSPVVRELPQDVTDTFKDSYVLEFLDLPNQHPESELKQRIIANLRSFLLEFGRDFAFIGEEYRLQVGNHDYYIDLLFYNRTLSCLVAVELKVVEFEPEFLGKLNFYLEALDRDVRKAHENPSIGILLCRGKDNEVVEYALSRSLSPTVVAAYQTQLPDKKLLQAKLHELFTDESDQ